MPTTLYLVFHHFSQLAIRQLPKNLRLYCELRPVEFYPAGRRTWGLALHPQGYGANLGEARGLTEPGLQLFHDLLQSVRPADAG